MPAARGGWRSLAAVVAGALTAGALATCGATEPVSSGEVVAGNGGPYRSGPVPVPTGGALLGAWVRPDSYGQAGRVRAVEDFQRSLGRPLDVVHSYRRLFEEIGTESDRRFVRSGATLMISWAGADSAEITAGEHDEAIAEDARQIKALGRPVLLRLRWEMDRPNLAASVRAPADYAAAWRHVRAVFDRERAANVSWVWCPTAEGFAQGRAAAYYPGDDTVDWTCVDVYAGSRLAPIGELLDPFLRWAAQRPKPIMIGEYGVASAWGSARRASWLRDATAFFRANPQIRAALYFDSDPDDRTEHGEFRISDDPAALAAFREAARDPWFNTGPSPAG